MLYACVQNAVQELLKTFENSTLNNYNQSADINTAANNLTDTTAAGGGNAVDYVINDGEVGQLLPQTVVNQTHNNNDDVDTIDAAAVNRTVSSHQRLQNPDNSTAGRRPGEVQTTVRKTSTSQTAVRRGRSTSMVATSGHRLARNASSAASLDRGATQRAQHSSERLYRRSLLPMTTRQQLQQGGRDRQSRQTSRQTIAARRRSDIGLPLSL